MQEDGRRAATRRHGAGRRSARAAQGHLRAVVRLRPRRRPRDSCCRATANTSPATASRGRKAAAAAAAAAGRRRRRQRGRVRVLAVARRVHADLLRRPRAAAPRAHRVRPHRAHEEHPRRLHEDRRAGATSRSFARCAVARAAHRARAAALAREAAALEAEFAMRRRRRARRARGRDCYDELERADARGSDGMPFLDEPDLRYRNRVWRPEPIARAAMFCLMDVSASMDEDKKDLAKRFFTLLYLFLTRKYERGRPDLHPPYRRRRGSRRGHVLPRPALGRHGRLLGARAGATRSARERYAQRLERLRGAGVRRRRVRRRSGAQRALPARAAAAGDALLHLSRADVARRAGPLVDAVGRIRAASPRRPTTSRCAARRGATRSTRCSASCSARKRDSMSKPSSRTGADWDFELLERYDAAIAEIAGRVRARHLSQPDRDHHVRADARRLRVERPAGRLSALVVRQGIHPQRAGVPARHAGARLRDRDQLQSVHRVPDGREHDDDAGAGDRARLLRPQLVLQGQSPVPAVDRRRRASSTTWCSRAATSWSARSATAPRRSRRCSTPATR